MNQQQTGQMKPPSAAGPGGYGIFSSANNYPPTSVPPAHPLPPTHKLPGLPPHYSSNGPSYMTLPSHDHLPHPHSSHHPSSSHHPHGLSSEEMEAARKRILLEEEAEREAKKNRGNYRCSKCGEPKKGHVCKYQPKYRKKEVNETESCEKEIQVELDPEMTVRLLPLEQQGLYESYLVQEPPQPHS